MSIALAVNVARFSVRIRQSSAASGILPLFRHTRVQPVTSYQIDRVSSHNNSMRIDIKSVLTGSYDSWQVELPRWNDLASCGKALPEQPVIAAINFAHFFGKPNMHPAARVALSIANLETFSTGDRFHLRRARNRKTVVPAPFSDVSPTARTQRPILKIFLHQNFPWRQLGKTEKNEYERNVFHVPYYNYLLIRDFPRRHSLW